MTYAEGKACMKHLEANGWRHVYTVIRDQGSKSERFGMLFTKQNLSSYETKYEFWLNKNTYKNLPD